ncbi:ABC transporter substrate-binding protein [Bradyrhizobium sp. B097]|uniref:ABC transporter substrate-binding protein n=1 Tax=Bradyrhizobium sp. B097 TaxID=3140244 RepID=UPI003182F685
MTLVVGAHPQNLSLSILARRPKSVAALREKGLTFFVYGAGSQTIPLLKAGVLHLAGTGATPPILAKAEGLATAVFGMSGPRPERGGLVVREASGIRSLSDLRGKGIGLMPISWHTQFLAAELDAAGLRWSDVCASEIIPVTAKDAFLEGLLDAIVATDPLYSQIAGKVTTRVLAAPGAAFSNRSVYWGLSEVLRDRPDAVSALLNALIESDRATANNPREAAALLAGLNGSSAEEWLPALMSRPWGVDAPDDGFLAEQQAHANIFAKFGLIPHAIDVTDTVDRTHFSAAA